MAAEGRLPLWSRPMAATFVLALNKPHVLALYTAHVLRLNKADVLALNMAHVFRLNTKICPELTANTKETTKGGQPKTVPPLWRRPKAASFVLAADTGHISVWRRTPGLGLGQAWARARLGPGPGLAQAWLGPRPGLGPGPAWAWAQLGKKEGTKNYSTEAPHM